jgi:hypothetical protein
MKFVYIKARKNERFMFFKVNEDIRIHAGLVDTLIDYKFFIEKSTENEFINETLITVKDNLGEIKYVTDFDMCKNECFEIEDTQELYFIDDFIQNTTEM